MNAPLSFRNGLSGPLRLRASGIGTFKVRSLRGLPRQKIEEMPPPSRFSPYSFGENQKGTAGRGRGKKKSRQFATNILAQAVWALRLVWGTGPYPLEPRRGCCAKATLSERWAQAHQLREQLVYATPLSER